MMKLYWAPRTRSLRALWVLEEAGVPYERVKLDLTAARGCARSTRGPVSVAEFGAICAYVAEAVPQAGLAPPLNDPARGRYLQWLFFSPGCIEPAFLTKSANIPVRPEMAIWFLTCSKQRSQRAPAADVMIGLDLLY